MARIENRGLPLLVIPDFSPRWLNSEILAISDAENAF
jgi:hypothetical protein